MQNRFGNYQQNFWTIVILMLLIVGFGSVIPLYRIPQLLL